MATNSLTLQFGDRTVQWQLSDAQAATIAQTMVQILGPAQEVTNDGS